MSSLYTPLNFSKLLIIFASLIIVIGGLKVAKTLLLPFLMAIFIAIICVSPLHWLSSKGIPYFISLMMVIIAIISLGGTMASIVGTSMEQFSLDLPEYEKQWEERVVQLTNWIKNKGIVLNTQDILKYLDPGAAMELAAKFFRGLGNTLANAFLIIITVIFILLEFSSFPNKIRAISKNPEASLAHFKKFALNINRYIAIKTATSLGTGVAIALWLSFLGVDYPALWGLLAFLLNYIPNIGSIIAAIPTVLLALIQLGPVTAAWSALGFFVVNNIVGNVIEPRLMGQGLGLSTLVVFVSLIFWGWILGPVGMFLSVPLTMTIKIAMETNQETRWIAILLSSDVPLDATS